MAGAGATAGEGRVMAPWTAKEKVAAEWTERLFKKTCTPGPVVPEPTTPEAVHAAIERFTELPTETGVMQDLAIGARRAAKGGLRS